MKLEEALRGIAGTFAIASVALAHLHSELWLLFTAFLGLNLLQSAFTNWCPMVAILQVLGIQRCNEVTGTQGTGYRVGGTTQ